MHVASTGNYVNDSRYQKFYELSSNYPNKNIYEAAQNQLVRKELKITYLLVQPYITNAFLNCKVKVCLTDKSVV